MPERWAVLTNPRRLFGLYVVMTIAASLAKYLTDGPFVHHTATTQINNFMIFKSTFFNLRAAGRADLIGDGCDALIPAGPPREAIEARRQRADHEVRGEAYVHQIPRAQPGPPRPAGSGYRPHRPGARRRNRRGSETP